MNRRSGAGTGIVMALLMGAGGALASCSLIVGVGDYAVGDAAVDAATRDDVGGGDDVGPDRTDARVVDGDAMRDATVVDAAADMALDAAAHGVREVSGNAPDAPDAGDARRLDAGGPDGEAGFGEAGVACGQGIPTGQANFQSLVSTCVHAVSCDPLVFPISLSDCLTNDSLQATGSLACLSTKQDCAGYYQCQGARYTTPTECPDGGLSTCDTVNNLAIDCYNSAVTNCTQTGGTCQTYTDALGNSRADCAVVNPCTVGDGGGQCASNNYYTCIPSSPGAMTGVGYGLNCTLAIATCTATATGGTACYFNGGGACSDAGSVACNGSTLAFCSSTGQFNYDCTRAGGSCVTDSLGNAGCVSPGCSLTSTCTESCDGNHTVTVCVGGAPYSIDCTQYGFSTCGKDSSSGNVYCFH